jgi:hypothetical protein
MTLVEEKLEGLGIKRSEWLAFLDGFSRQHEGWLASIEIVTATDRLVEARNGRLMGISIDHPSERQRVYITLGEALYGNITHVIPVPARIVLKRTESGAHEGLEIASMDGRITTLRFRSPMLPEMLDDVA